MIVMSKYINETINCQCPVYDENTINCNLLAKTFTSNLSCQNILQQINFVYKCLQIMIDMPWKDVNGSWIDGHPKNEIYCVIKYTLCNWVIIPAFCWQCNTTYLLSNFGQFTFVLSDPITYLGYFNSSMDDNWYI